MTCGEVFSASWGRLVREAIGPGDVISEENSVRRHSVRFPKVMSDFVQLNEPEENKYDTKANAPKVRLRPLTFLGKSARFASSQVLVGFCVCV